jgi:hypothetical protein
MSYSQLTDREAPRTSEADWAGGPELNEVLWRHLDRSFTYLRHLDEYGTTTFNGLQMIDVLPELERLASAAGTDGESRVMKRVLDLARRCIDEQPHVFLVFVGD